MRLIDADELMEHVWRDKLDSRELIAKMIDNAPTVKEIPTNIPIDVFEQLISQDSVLDKIRAEIKQKLGTHGNLSVYNKAIHDALMIIDKYKAESEVEDDKI